MASGARTRWRAAVKPGCEPRRAGLDAARELDGERQLTRRRATVAPCRERSRVLTDPACLFRAGLVCTRWRRILADPAFLRRRRALHRTAPVLGFVRVVNSQLPFASRFAPSDASGRPAARDLPGWLALDCRHGRALFLTPSPGLRTEVTLDLVVWDPLTNEQRRLPSPWSPPLEAGGVVSDGPFGPLEFQFNAAVLCAAAAQGCDHRDCRGGPFRVVFICTNPISIGGGGYWETKAWVFSSETGTWAGIGTYLAPNVCLDISPCPSALVGDAVYFRANASHIFVCRFGAQPHSLTMIYPPIQSLYILTFSCPMLMEDGGLGFANVEEEPSLCIRLWSLSRERTSAGYAQWTQGRAIELEPLLPDGALPSPLVPSVPPDRNASVVGFVEGTDIIFVSTWSPSHTAGGVYMVLLNSLRARRVLEDHGVVFPYTSFCIPVIDAAYSGEAPGAGVSRT
ncbi:hypothetical protein ACP4OV_015900 [Aristida adscensionis]